MLILISLVIMSIEPSASTQASSCFCLPSLSLHSLPCRTRAHCNTVLMGTNGQSRNPNPGNRPSRGGLKRGPGSNTPAQPRSSVSRVQRGQSTTAPERSGSKPQSSRDDEKPSGSKNMEGFDPKRMEKGVKFLGSFDSSPPPTKLPEVAFVGRSNVGKSSLLNSLTGQKIAVTSKTPGRTQRINLFAVKDDKNSEVRFQHYRLHSAPLLTALAGVLHRRLAWLGLR